MIRAALAVVLTAALVSASVPAIDDARQDRTAARMERAADRIAHAAGDLREDDPARFRGHTPRRVVRIRLPTRSWTRSAVERVRLAGSGSGREATLSFSFPGGRRSVRLLAPALRTPVGPIVLREPGTHRVRLALLRRRDGTAVIATRGFENGSLENRPAHSSCSSEHPQRVYCGAW